MPHQKPHLPEKICQHCQRPFAWRKKWVRDWQNVKYCSQRCRDASRGKGSGESSGPSELRNR